MSEPDPLEMAAAVAASLEGLGVRYLVGGSLASTAFGEPRATLDVDIVVDLQPETVSAWLDALGDDFLVDREWALEEVRRRGSFQLLHRVTMTRIDVFVPPWEGVHLWKWQNRRRLVLDPGAGRALDVTAPEGVVVQKLSWYRDGGEVSDRQWRDVVGVLKTQRAALDVAETRRWAAEVGVEHLLVRALGEAGMA